MPNKKSGKKFRRRNQDALRLLDSNEGSDLRSLSLNSSSATMALESNNLLDPYKLRPNDGFDAYFPILNAGNTVATDSSYGSSHMEPNELSYGNGFNLYSLPLNESGDMIAPECDHGNSAY